jgi:hypothetical protein
MRTRNVPFITAIGAARAKAKALKAQPREAKPMFRIYIPGKAVFVTSSAASALTYWSLHSNETGAYLAWSVKDYGLLT